MVYFETKRPMGANMPWLCTWSPNHPYTCSSLDANKETRTKKGQLRTKETLAIITTHTSMKNEKKHGQYKVISTAHQL